MKLIVVDEFGINTSVSIRNISTFSNENGLSIYGKLKFVGVQQTTKLLSEPEIGIDFIDQDGNILFATVGSHVGCFRMEQQATFKIEVSMQQLREHCDLRKIEFVKVYVYFEAGK